MPLTYQAIATVTVGSGGAASISFTSIPQTFIDLKIVLSGRSNGTSFPTAPWQNCTISLNTTQPTAYKQLYGTGAGTGSDSQSAGVWTTSNIATTNTFGSVDIYLPNYLSTTSKSISVDNVTESNGSDFAAVLWTALFSTVTSAVTSATLTPVSGTFLQNSTATLYGIKNS